MDLFLVQLGVLSVNLDLQFLHECVPCIERCSPWIRWLYSSVSAFLCSPWICSWDVSVFSVSSLWVRFGVLPGFAPGAFWCASLDWLLVRFGILRELAFVTVWCSRWNRSWIHISKNCLINELAGRCYCGRLTRRTKRKLLTLSCTLPYTAYTYTQLVLEQVASLECQLALLAALAADALPFVHVYC